MSNYSHEHDDIEIIYVSLDDEAEEETKQEIEVDKNTETNAAFEVISEKTEKKTDLQAAPDTEQPDKPDSIIKEIFSYVIIVALSFLVACAVNKFVIINAYIPSSSMEPTVSKGDKLLGFRLAYLFSKPEQGDVIIFKFPDDEKQNFIKRVIGTPGDEILIKDGQLYVNGELIEEDYIAEDMTGNYGPYIVPDDSYFVLGDNRNISDDARFWNNTYVTSDEIIAKAWLRYSPKINQIK